MSGANDGTFLTKTNVGGKKKSKKNRDDDSPTARAAMALQMLNGKQDQSLALAIRDTQTHTFDARKLGQIAEDELNQTEKDMQNMYKELEELENMIKGNVDLTEMDSLMKSTTEVI